MKKEDLTNILPSLLDTKHVFLDQLGVYTRILLKNTKQLGKYTRILAKNTQQLPVCTRILSKNTKQLSVYMRTFRNCNRFRAISSRGAECL